MKIRIKRYGCLIIFLCMLIGLTGCGKNHTKLQNYVNTLTLTEEEERFLNLTSTNQQYIFFEYQTDENTYKELNFWVELYNKGKLIDSNVVRINYMYDEPRELVGDIGIIINPLPDIKWSISCTENKGYRAYNESEPRTLDFEDDECPMTGDCSIFEPAEIEKGRETLLYASITNGNGKIRAFDLERIKEPDFLKENDYVYLIKCKFS